MAYDPSKARSPTTRYIAWPHNRDWREIHLAYSRPVFDNTRTGLRTLYAMERDKISDEIQLLKEKIS